MTFDQIRECINQLVKQYKVSDGDAIRRFTHHMYDQWSIEYEQILDMPAVNASQAYRDRSQHYYNTLIPQAFRREFQV